MEYFIGLIPPDDLKNRLIEFRQTQANVFPLLKTEPHITIVPPQKKESEIDFPSRLVEELCAKFSPIQVLPKSVKQFRNSVVHIEIESKNAMELHDRLMKELRIYGKFYTPHLTLLNGRNKMSELGKIQSAMKEAEQVLSPFEPFTANFIRVFIREEDKGYRRFRDFKFAGS